MHGSDLAVLGGSVIYRGEIVKLDILIRDGRIVKIGREVSPLECKKIDASGKLVLPGVIDSHVHMREPGSPEKEDFGSGTTAAAAGGVTVVLDMPNNQPPVDSATRLTEKAKLVEPKAAVDFGLLVVLHDGNVKEVPAMVKAGAVGLKGYLGPTTGELPPPSDSAIYESLVALRGTGTPIAFHAEDAFLVNHFTDSVRKEGRTDPTAHADARPVACEAVAISKVAGLARRSGGKAHVVHVTTEAGLALVEEEKRRGTKMTCETCPHYLSLTREDMAVKGPSLKVNPPLRALNDLEALWRGVGAGVVDTLASDHAPHLVAEKRRANVWEVPSGLIGVETLVPVMLDFVNRGSLTIQRFVEMTSLNPARIYNLCSTKGRMAEGFDGDLTVVDMSEEYVIKAEELHSKNKITPFEGRAVKGRVKYTVVRGAVVYDGEAVNPSGAWIRPAEA
jgi:dihydroorotase